MEIDKGNVGRIAERIVMNELEARGYHIIDLAYSSKTFANVDFIASKNGRSFNVQVKGSSHKGRARRGLHYGYCTDDSVARRVPVFNCRSEAALRADVVVLVAVTSPREYAAIVLPVGRAEEAAQINLDRYYRMKKRDGGERKPGKIWIELDEAKTPRFAQPEKDRERQLLVAHLNAWDLANPPPLPPA